MVDLDFAVTGVEVERTAAAPLLLFKLRVTNRTPVIPVENVMLQSQIRIEATRRRYGPREQERLVELFGPPGDWGHALHSMLWTHANVSIPGFGAACAIDLPVPCSYDFNVAATKYFHGMESGEVPLLLLFSGTVFYRDAGGHLQIDQIAWSKQATHRLPVQLWRAMMDHYYADSVWLHLGRDTFEGLHRFKRQRGLATWEQALQLLLEERSAEVPV